MKIAMPHDRRLRDHLKVAIAQETNANKAVQAFRRRIETQYGLPVVFELLGANGSSAGTARPYWEQHTDVRCHSIDLDECEPWVKPAKLAHELMHIALECEAHAAGKRRTGIRLPQTQANVLSLCNNPPEPDDVQLINRIASYAKNMSVDMVVDARLLQELPEVTPAQFVGLHTFDSTTRSNLHGWQLSPILHQALKALAAVRSLFVDTYFPNPPHSCFEQFRGTRDGDLGEKLFAEFKSRFDRGLQPGEHYALADRHAEILGLPGLHSWSPKPAFRLLKPTPSLAVAPTSLCVT